MKYQITGADKETGEDVSMVLEAANEQDAADQARIKGIYPSKIVLHTNRDNARNIKRDSRLKDNRESEKPKIDSIFDFYTSLPVIQLFDIGFKKYLTPAIIKLTWVLVLVLVVIWIVVSSINATDTGGGTGFGTGYQDSTDWSDDHSTSSRQSDFFSAVYIVVRNTIIGALVLMWVRVLLEGAIVIFKISQSVDKIKEHFAGHDAGP